MGFFDKLKEKAAALLATEPEQPKSAPPVKRAPASSTPKEPTVYVTLKGKKFHYSILCPGIRNAKEIRMPLSKARKAGYTACDKCEKYQYIEDYELL